MTVRIGPNLVVVLEDDVGAAEALAALLVAWGYDCVHGDGFEAVAAELAARSAEVAAIISDYHLGGGATGPQAIAALAEAGVAAPVLILTGTLAGRARRAALADGHQVMEKPAAPKRLRAWIEQMVDLNR